MLRKLDLLPLEAEVGNFYSVTAASCRICEIEGRDGDTHGLFLEFYVETGEWGTDEERSASSITPANVRVAVSSAPDRIDAGYPLRFFPTVTFGEKGQ